MLSDGNLPRDLSFNGDRSRRSSVDTIGDSGDNDGDRLRPGKRRKREMVISPVESNYSLRGRSKTSPTDKQGSLIADKATARKVLIPGIEVSHQDESISPVSEATPIPERTSNAKQAMRISFNSKGGGRLIISNAGTPAASNRGSARPSPAPGMIMTDANTPEEVAPSKQARRPPGRRRNPHKDPKIEAAIRRQAELKRCYRTISRAMRPILIELSTRGVNELDEDAEAHKSYPEYEQAMAALDYYYEKRQQQIDAQQEIGLKFAANTRQQDEEYLLMQHSDKMHELQEIRCMELMNKLISAERIRSYQADPQMSEDDFDEEIVPLRTPDAFLRKSDDPARNLDPKYDSRSRKIVIAGQKADHFGRLKVFDDNFKRMLAERDESLDEKYGACIDTDDEQYEEIEYDLSEMILDSLPELSESPEEASDRLALLLKAAALSDDSRLQIEKDQMDTNDVSAQGFESLDALCKAIEIRQANEIHYTARASNMNGSAIKSESPKFSIPLENHRIKSHDTLAPMSISPSRLVEDDLVLKTSRTASPRQISSTNIPSGIPKTVQLQDTLPRVITSRHPSSLDAASKSVVSLGKRPLTAARSETVESTRASYSESTNHSQSLRDTDFEAPTLPNLEGDEGPEEATTAALDAARQVVKREAEKFKSYTRKVKSRQIEARATEDEAALRQFYHMIEREGKDKGKSWLTIKKEKLATWEKEVTERPPGPRVYTSQVDRLFSETELTAFRPGGEYAHLKIPYNYTLMFLFKEKSNNLALQWLFARQAIPHDAVEPADRDRFMEIADQRENGRFSYYYAKWALYCMLFKGDSANTTTNKDKEEMFASMLSRQEEAMKSRDERFTHALKVWPQHQIERARKIRLQDLEAEYALEKEEGTNFVKIKLESLPEQSRHLESHWNEWHQKELQRVKKRMDWREGMRERWYKHAKTREDMSPRHLNYPLEDRWMFDGLGTRLRLRNHDMPWRDSSVKEEEDVGFVGEEPKRVNSGFQPFANRVDE
jgi:hypothetical protein